MTLQQLILGIQESAVGEWMRYTPRAMPVVEAAHVMAACIVFGTLLVVDLRLIGLSGTRTRFTSISRQMLPITWIAFGLSVITGALMFTTSAQVYSGNAAFRLKMLALLAAGINMAIFQLVTRRSVACWDPGRPPRAAHIAGAVSILLWAAVVLLGRWIGFTKGYDFTIPPGFEFDFGN